MSRGDVAAAGGLAAKGSSAPGVALLEHFTRWPARSGRPSGGSGSGGWPLRPARPAVDGHAETPGHGSPEGRGMKLGRSGCGGSGQTPATGRGGRGPRIGRGCRGRGGSAGVRLESGPPDWSEAMATSADVGLLVLRVGVGGALAAHGTQKLFGWFGGGGVDGTAAMFDKAGFRPARLNAIAAGITETGGGALLAAGIATPAAGAAIAGTMVVASSMLAPKGFFAAKGGYEYAALIGVGGVSVTLSRAPDRPILRIGWPEAIGRPGPALSATHRRGIARQRHAVPRRGRGCRRRSGSSTVDDWCRRRLPCRARTRRSGCTARGRR